MGSVAKRPLCPSPRGSTVTENPSDIDIVATNAKHKHEAHAHTCDKIAEISEPFMCFTSLRNVHRTIDHLKQMADVHPVQMFRHQ